jgi:signal recognition particle receptor subunit beta
MASINYASKEIYCKLVYYGPGLCGKTTNLQTLFSSLDSSEHGDMVSLATPGERTLYFDFLPINVMTIGSFTVRFALYTVPGQTQYNATRKLVLRGADGIVFVADSQWDIMQENQDSFNNLNLNLSEYRLNLRDVPHVIQFNKRDLPDIAPTWYMNQLLNLNNVPTVESVAVANQGVMETLQTLCKFVIRDLVHRYNIGAL